MNKEYKDFINQVFHRKDHDMYEPDYYSWRYEIVKEENDVIALRLDTKLLDKPLHDLVTNLMEWGLMITKLVIASDRFDDEWLYIEIAEVAARTN
jgi:hypothetical protein